MNATFSAPAVVASPTRPALVVPLALAGTFVANLGAQLVATHVAQIQQGVGASAGDASWLVTLHTVAAFFAFAMAPLKARTFGLRRLFIASAAVFALAAGVGAFAESLPVLLGVRALQGFAGGMFGPLAFVAIFRAWSGPRIPLGFALLAFVLLVSANAAAAIAPAIESTFGWRALFAVQVVLGMSLLVAGWRWLPGGAMNAFGKASEWVALFLLAIATASLVVVFGQGTRHGWFDSALIVSAVAVSLAAWVGFALVHRMPGARVLIGGKLLDRRFGLPIALNFLFRASFATTVFLLPLMFAMSRTQGQAHAAWWLLLPQIAAFPLAWRLMHRVDKRVPMALGLSLVAIGIWSATHALLPSLALIGVGQMLFLVPALVTGASSLRPEHGPTATVVFNMSTAGGTTLGVGLLSHFVAERASVHAAAMPAIDDAFSLVAAVLLGATFVIASIGRTPPLPHFSHGTQQ